MDTNYELDRLAEVVCDTLEESIDSLYADSKRDWLNGFDRFKVLIWMNCLDATRMKLVAKKLNVNEKDLRFVVDFLTRI